MPQDQAAGRQYEIDWLRNFVILLLFPFHAARMFDIWEPNYIKNTDLSMGLSVLVAVLSLWFMALLFLLAGMSTWHALQKRGGGGYVRERVGRLLVPFVFGLIAVVPVQGYAARLSRTGYAENCMSFLGSYFTDFSDLSGYAGSFTPAHLWFILYLFVISLAALPLLNRWRKGDGGYFKRHADFFSRPWALVLQCVPMTVMEALPGICGKNPFYYLYVFVWGYVLCTDGRYMASIDGMRRWTGPAALGMLAVWLLLIRPLSGYPDLSWPSAVLALVRNLAVCLILMALLGYGRKYLNRPAPALTYMNEAAYPVYILHQSVMMVIAYFVVGMRAGIAVKYVLIMVLTFAACLALYEGVLKRTGVTRWLFGIKIAKKA